MQVKLDIYIEPGCTNCDQARHIAQIVRERMPQVDVSVIDISQSDVSRPANVFAVPTYLLNGEMCSLGNPDTTSLLARLEEMAAG